MMSAAPQALTDGEITRELIAIRDFAAARNAPMTHDFEDANVENVRAVARAMIEVGVLARHEGGVETVYGVAPGQQFTASYYRNTVVHLFVTNALIELALADAMDSAPGASETDFWRALLSLRDLFKFEFFYSPADTFRAEATAELDRQGENWRLRINAGGAAAGELLHRMTPLFSPGVLKPIVDAYAVVADALLRLKSGDPTDEKDVVALCLKLGREAVLRQKIAGSESIAKFLYANGWALARQRGLVEGEADALAGGRLAFAREMKAIQARIRLIESIAAGRRAAHELGLSAVEPTSAPPLRASQGTPS
jgi:glycerol-3-phosphate O-acyltransferase